MNNIKQNENNLNLIKSLKEWKKSSSYEDIKIKEIIKKELLNNELILHALNNPELDTQDARSYYGKNILPYYLVPPVQTDIQNYICFDTGFTEMPRYNDVLKYQQITFYILCNCASGNVIDKDTGIARHDLLSSLIIDQFNWENTFGFQIHLVSEQSRPVDSKFCAKTLIFEQTTPNSVVKNGQVVNRLG